MAQHPGATTSSAGSDWSTQGNEGTGGLYGPGTATLQACLVNETGGSSTIPTYPFWFPGSAELQFPLTHSGGEMTFSLFALVQGMSQLVYAAVAIGLIEVPGSWSTAAPERTGPRRTSFRCVAEGARWA